MGLPVPGALAFVAEDVDDESKPTREKPSAESPCILASKSIRFEGERGRSRLNARDIPGGAIDAMVSNDVITSQFLVKRSKEAERER